MGAQGKNTNPLFIDFPKQYSFSTILILILQHMKIKKATGMLLNLPEQPDNFQKCLNKRIKF